MNITKKQSAAKNGKKIAINDIVRYCGMHREIVVIFFMVVFSIILQVASRGNFLTLANLSVIANNKSPEMLITMIITLVLITGNFDLTVAATMALSGVVCAWLMTTGGQSVIVGILGGLVVGLIFGTLNGVLVSRMGINSFIATLGTQYIARSLALVICDGSTIGGLPEAFLKIQDVKFLGLIWYFWLLVILVVVLSLLLHKQKTMAKLFYVGTNAHAADMVGIKSKKLIMLVYLVSGVFASFVGIILSSYTRSGSAIAFEGLETRYISAAVIGGSSVSGGQGSMYGAVLGYILVVLIGNGMTLLNISVYYENVIFGALLMIAAIADAMTQRRRGG